jgi:hypothetical protein
MRRRINKYIIFRNVIIAVLLLLLFITPVRAQYNENVIKAAYIERITRFVEWPSKDILKSHDNFVVGVYDENLFFNTLSQVFKGKSIKDQKVTIIQIKTPGQLKGCDLCYISEDAKTIVNEFVVEANASGVLLISATDGFCKSGVHINFYIEEEKLKFEINEKSITSAGFKVSYLLMQNTRIVQ